MKVKILTIEFLALAMSAFVIAAIHYNLHSLNQVNTIPDAVVAAFSFAPGIVIGYLAIHLQRLLGKDDPAPTFAFLISFAFFALCLFRAATMFVRMSYLSDWTRVPVNALVDLFDVFT